MFKSTEIRWFYQGIIPDGILEWYRRTIPQAPESNKRIDHYLRMAGPDSPGIKLREGRMEVKQRFGMREEWRSPTGQTGLIEHWQKWSYALNDPEAVKTDLETHASSWVPVAKRRTLQMFSVDETLHIEPSPPNSLLLNGCGFELTTLELPGRDESWWTLGMEAFGKTIDARKILDITLKAVALDESDFRFCLENSSGYPQWLALFSHNV